MILARAKIVEFSWEFDLRALFCISTVVTYISSTVVTFVADRIGKPHKVFYHQA